MGIPIPGKDGLHIETGPWRCVISLWPKAPQWRIFGRSVEECADLKLAYYQAALDINELTHLPLVPYICVGELGHHWFRLWLAACLAPSHYLNQRWLIVNWTLRNKPQWNSNRNTTRLIHENMLETVVCKKAAFLSSGGDELRPL